MEKPILFIGVSTWSLPRSPKPLEKLGSLVIDDTCAVVSNLNFGHPTEIIMSETNGNVPSVRIKRIPNEFRESLGWFSPCNLFQKVRLNLDRVCVFSHNVTASITLSRRLPKHGAPEITVGMTIRRDISVQIDISANRRSAKSNHI